MKERPILFSAPMVRAILEGRKMQTRRIAKLTLNGHAKEPGGHRRWHPQDPEAIQACPYGQPGNRLWVRETWCPRSNGQLLLERAQHPFYAADNDNGKPLAWRWRPSIHMPRWASRLLLEVTAVRVERLQAISEDDAIAEGCKPHEFERSDDCGNGWTEHHYRGGFIELWESINGRESWQRNPWVWVVSFQKVQPCPT